MRFYPCLAARFSTWCGHSTLSSFGALWSVRLCHSHPSPPTHPTALRRFCAASSAPHPTSLSLSSSSTVPTQNFFKCLIFPPFGFLFAGALSLVCPSIFHPSAAAAPLLPPSHPPPSIPLSSPPALFLHLSCLSLLCSAVDANWFIFY